MENAIDLSACEAVEDQIDRLNYLLKDVMSNFTCELQSQSRPTLSSLASPKNAAQITDLNRTLQFDMLSTSCYPQDNFTEFNFSVLEADGEAYVEEERLLMQLEDYRTHAVRNEYGLDSSKEQELLLEMKENMYNAVTDVKYRLELDIDGLKARNEYLCGVVASQAQEVGCLKQQLAAARSTNSSQSKMQLIRSALNEVTGNPEQTTTHLDTIEKVMCSDMTSPTKLAAHIDKLKTQAINQRGQEVIKSAQTKATTLSNAMLKLERSFSFNTISNRKKLQRTKQRATPSKTLKRREKRSMTNLNQTQAQCNRTSLNLADLSTMSQRPASPSICSSRSVLSHASSASQLPPRQQLTTDQLTNQLLSLKSEKAIKDTQSKAKALDRSISKLQLIESRFQGSLKSVRTPRDNMSVTSSAAMSVASSVTRADTSEEVRAQKTKLRLAQQSVEAEKHQLMLFAQELAAKQRSLLVAEKCSNQKSKIDYIINMMEREKSKMLEEKKTIEQERVKIESAKTQMQKEGVRIGAAKKHISSKIGELVAAEQAMAAQISTLNAEKRELASILSSVVN